MIDVTKINGVDLRMNEDGDLVINENGDFDLVRKQDFIEQSARNRLRISDPEWTDFASKTIGANLEDLLGMSNTPETAKLGVQMIMTTLTRDGLISAEDLYVRPIPVKRNVIEFYVFIRINDTDEPIGFVVSFNLESGAMIRSV